MSEKTPDNPLAGKLSSIPKFVIEIDGSDVDKAAGPRELAQIGPFVPDIPRPKTLASMVSKDPYLDRLVQQAIHATPPSSSPPPPEPPPEEIESAALKLCDAIAGGVYGWVGTDGERRILLQVAMNGPGVESSPFNKRLMAAYHYAVCWMVRAKLIRVEFGLAPLSVAYASIPSVEGSKDGVPLLKATKELWNRRRMGSIFGRSTEESSQLFRLIDISDACALMPHRWREIEPLHPNGYDAGIGEQSELWHAVFGGIGVATGTRGATGPDTVVTVPTNLVQRASAELHGAVEPVVVLREMGAWLERWGRAFHPFAPVGDRESVYREQAALVIEWWFLRRRLMDTLARLGVMVPKDLVDRAALKELWNSRELVTHCELMNWLNNSRPSVQLPGPPLDVRQGEEDNPQDESFPSRELREFVPLVENPRPFQPTPPPPGRNPYLNLRHVLHELFWLAACARQGQDVLQHLNPITGLWDEAESRARGCSAGWGIPFGTFDPLLTDAKRTMRELAQIAEGNTSLVFSVTDSRYALLEERIQELANSIPPEQLYGPMPAGVRNWLTASYLADPTPGLWQLAQDAESEPIVLVRFEDFARFLLSAGFDLLPHMEDWKNAGWIEDVRVDITPTDNPNDTPPQALARLNLPLGNHRLVGIRKAVLNAPTQERTSSPPAARPKNQALTPDQFDFDGLVVSGFTMKQLKLLRFTKDGGTFTTDGGSAGAPVPEVLRHLGYNDDVNGRKALNQLRQRTQEVMDSHKPPSGYLLTTVNDHICLAHTSG